MDRVLVAFGSIFLPIQRRTMKFRQRDKVASRPRFLPRLSSDVLAGVILVPGLLNVTSVAKKTNKKEMT